MACIFQPCLLFLMLPVTCTAARFESGLVEAFALRDLRKLVASPPAAETSHHTATSYSHQPTHTNHLRSLSNFHKRKFEQSLLCMRSFMNFCAVWRPAQPFWFPRSGVLATVAGNTRLKFGGLRHQL